jgi:hypothetical protein
MQEMVLAREILVWCGEHEIIFDDLCTVTEGLSYRYKVQSYPSSAGTGHRLFQPPNEHIYSHGKDTFECLRTVAGAIEEHFHAVVKTKIA